MFRSHWRNPEGVTYFADREPLPKSPAEIRQRPLAPNSDFLEELSEWRLAKYTGQSTRKPPQASVGRLQPFRASKKPQSSAHRWTPPVCQAITQRRREG